MPNQLAMKYPELAGEILTRPIPKATQTQPVPNTKAARSLSSNLHTPDRPHWAVASMEAVMTQPSSGTSYDGESAASNRESLRARGGGINQSVWAPRQKSRHSLQDPTGERHEPPPHRRVAVEYNQPPSSASLIERLSEPSNTKSKTSVGGKDTGTCGSSQIQGRGRDLANGNRNNPLSAASSFGHSDLGADHEIPNEWGPVTAHSWNSVPNATNALYDNTYQQVPSSSGTDRLGRHVITPKTSDIKSEEQKQATRRAFKQQVSDLNIAARSYLEGSDRGSRRASSSNSSNRGVEIDENPDETLEERFHRLNCSDSQRSIDTQRETPAYDFPTPKLHSEESPFRDTQLRTINTPHASQIPYSHSSNSKLHMFSAVSSIQLQENRPTSNNYIDPADEWLPVQPSADDWDLPKPPNPHRLAPFRVLHAADDSNAHSSSKPFARNHSNSHHVTRNTGPSYQSGPDPCTNRPARFEEASSNNVGPSPETRPQYTKRSRQSLPAQAEAYSQHLATTNFPSNYGGRRGRGWRGDRRGPMNPSTQYAQPRHDPYGPTTSEDDDGWEQPMVTGW
ncbi:hypothetical protein H0H87_001702 [Tephrocybe sp. NHM501043]|nr:hypothetical protein H0H87_001702 [Tephrocybe sp. NHM501043]